MPTLTGTNDAYFPAGDVATTPQLIDDNVTLTDAEGDFDGGTLAVSGLLAEDIVGLLSTGNAAGEIAVVGSDVFFGGVLIGSVAGGAGVDLTVTFNAAATTAGVEATIEALTYQNPSATPTDIRDLSITVTDAAGNNTLRDQYFEAPSQPFDPGTDLVDSSAPTLGDLDGDGDLDLVVGDGYGNLHYFENVGTAAAPAFSELTGAANPFDGFTGDRVKPTLADLDGDGDLDLAVGEYDGTVRYLRNDSGVFIEQTGAGNPMTGIDIGYGASPAYADLDGDLDLDLVVGRRNGDIYYFENTGDDNAPVFVERTDGGNPFDGWSLPGNTLALADVDGDGDFDLVTGLAEGPVLWLENVGTAAAPVYAGGDFTLFDGVNVFFGGAAAFGDLDGDGDLELVLGQSGGELTYYEVALRPVVVEVFVDAAATAQDDAVSGGEAGVITGDVFADNGSGADSAGATVIEINGQSADVGQQITLESGALLTLNADGTFSYDPNGAFDDLSGPGSGGTNEQGTDSFTYTVNGGATATVTIQLSGVDTDDLVTGTAGDDLLNGGVGDDRLEGGDGDDYLRGGVGADAMFGGLGNDTYVVTDTGDTADETGGDGVDKVVTLVSFTLGAGIENLTLNAPGRNIDGTGNALANVITGNDFENVLTGLDGDDTLNGGGRNDTLYGGSGADRLDGGSHDDLLFGDAGNDVLLGGAGHDRLDGGTGADAMQGGLGNDTYVVDDVLDTAVEGSNGGLDTVEAWVDWTLGDNVENLTMMGSADQAGQGNALRNVIVGNGGANTISGGGELDTISGGGGDDVISGDAGNDVLSGDAGDDRIAGGGGNDKLTGGTGADAFVFIDADLKPTTIGGALERDQILDLSFAEGDRIDLSAIDANIQTGGNDAFTWAVGNRFSGHAGELVITYVPGANVTTLAMDVDGDGKADFFIGLNGNQTGTTGNLYTGPEDANGGWIL